jgi:hypothetical protein
VLTGVSGFGLCLKAEISFNFLFSARQAANWRYRKKFSGIGALGVLP